ncbi:MAG: ATP-binding protein [Hyphomonadaceae bacterium]
MATSEDTREDAVAEGGGELKTLIARAQAWIAGAQPAQTPQDAAPEEAAPAALLETLAPIVEALPEPAVLIGADGRVAAANEAARKRFGFAPGLRFSAVLRHPSLLDAAQGALRDGEKRALDYVATAPVEEHFRCAIAPIDWEGTPGALIVFSNRTAVINAERMRADFVANASHELRTPLTALSMLIETIAGPARDSEADRAKFLDMMQVQAARMRRLIDDLLALSRIELDEHVPPDASADLAAVAREAADSASPLARPRNVRLEVIAPDGRLPVRGDHFQIVQIAQNLIDNAIKFSPDGGVVRIEAGAAGGREDALDKAGKRWPEAGRISLLTPAPAPDRTYGFLRVTDTGPGIAMRFLPRLGERFFRVEREEGRDRGGTGLGLAIVKHIVNRCRGGFVVESEPGRGSAFAIYLEKGDNSALG